MVMLGALKFYLLSSLCVCFLFVVIKLFHKLWWSPRRIQNLMASQGIRGPRYRFLQGTTKEMRRMRKEAMLTPMEQLSHDIFPKVAPHVYAWTKLYGMNFLHWIGPQAQLVITDMELVKVVLNNKDGEYPKIPVQGHGKKLLGYGLATAKGEKWQKQRKLANHAFHGEALKDMTPLMVASVEMMLERWTSHSGKEIEVFHEFKLLTSEVISRTAFGSSYLEGEHMFNMLRKMIIVIQRNAYKVELPLIGKFLKTSDDVETDMLEQGVRECIIRMINKEKTISNGEATSFGSDYLGSLLNAYHSKDETTKLSIDDVIDECKTFYLTGQETTLCLLTWTVLLLAIHSEWQQRAREEVLQLFGHENPTTHGLSRLPTMGMIINESLRLYPPVVQTNRKTTRQVRLGEITIPADVQVNVSIPALHHNPKIWGHDAHMFKPERFAQGVAKATNNNAAAFLPFGMGPRTCVGLNFATNETKIALSMILQRYKLDVSPSYVHSPFPLLLTRPQHGLQIILRPV